MRLIPGLLSLLCLLSLLAALPAPAEVPTLPDAVGKRIKSAPEAFVEAAAVLIMGYGGEDGIDRAGVENYIALERSGARASALRRLLAADLDGDGAVTAVEMAVAAAAASATQRGRLWALQARADADGNGVVSAVEVGVHAQAEAMKGFSEARAQAARAILGFDGDGDGWVTLDEVRAVVEALNEAA